MRIKMGRVSRQTWETTSRIVLSLNGFKNSSKFYLVGFFYFLNNLFLNQFYNLPSLMNWIKIKSKLKRHTKL
jgi:hypothetical protein